MNWLKAIWGWICRLHKKPPLMWAPQCWTWVCGVYSNPLMNKILYSYLLVATVIGFIFTAAAIIDYTKNEPTAQEKVRAQRAAEAEAVQEKWEKQLQEGDNSFVWQRWKAARVRRAKEAAKPKLTDIADIIESILDQTANELLLVSQVLGALREDVPANRHLLLRKQLADAKAERLAAVKRGDQAAYRTLVNTHQEAFGVVLRRLVRDRQRAWEEAGYGSPDARIPLQLTSRHRERDDRLAEVRW